MKIRRPDGPRWSPGPAMRIAGALKAGCGALAVILAVQLGAGINQLNEQIRLSAAWEKTSSYAVFYPQSVGNDRTEFEAGGMTTSIAQARDLYPALERAGAIYVDARNYRPDARVDSEFGKALVVNRNYLDQYPVKDDSGRPLEVKSDDDDWIVAAPATYKPREAELREYFQLRRTGTTGFDGAIQGQRSYLKEPVPKHLEKQQVRIVWTQPGQRVFSFNSLVNPSDGNLILDPIIQVMTPANSMSIDRINAVSGDLNPPLKVRIDSAPSDTLAEILPLLKELKLDDNLQYLVTGNEAILAEISGLQRGLGWTIGIAAAALLAMMFLSAALVVIGSDRLRRVLTVRRLHGIGLLRSYRELLLTLGAIWLIQAILAFAFLLVRNLNQRDRFGNVVDLFAGAPLLLAGLCAVLLLETVFVIITVQIVERRNSVRRLQER